jgi:hypothetical protein
LLALFFKENIEIFALELDDPPKSTYRNFQRLRDIQIARERLRENRSSGPWFLEVVAELVGAERPVVTERL